MKYPDCECGNPRYDQRDGCDECRRLQECHPLRWLHSKPPKRVGSKVKRFEASPYPDLPRVVMPTLGLKKWLRQID